MIIVSVTDRAGDTAHIETSPEAGLSLMEVIRNNSSMSIEAICGGMMSCSTCHVYIDEDWVDEIGSSSEEERALIEDSGHFKSNSRLSCQIRITASCDGLHAVIAPED